MARARRAVRRTVRKAARKAAPRIKAAARRAVSKRTGRKSAQTVRIVIEQPSQPVVTAGNVQPVIPGKARF